MMTSIKMYARRPWRLFVSRKQTIPSPAAAAAASCCPTIGNYEWSIGPGECQRCSAYVPQLTRRKGACTWLCDECAEDQES